MTGRAPTGRLAQLAQRRRELRAECEATRLQLRTDGRAVAGDVSTALMAYAATRFAARRPWLAAVLAVGGFVGTRLLQRRR